MHCFIYPNFKHPISVAQVLKFVSLLFQKQMHAWMAIKYYLNLFNIYHSQRIEQRMRIIATVRIVLLSCPIKHLGYIYKDQRNYCLFSQPQHLVKKEKSFYQRVTNYW